MEFSLKFHVIGDRTNMTFMSTSVAKGRGKGIVVRIGKSTEVGAISKALIKPSNKKTLLQARLTKLGKILVVISVVLCAIVVAIGKFFFYIHIRFF